MNIERKISVSLMPCVAAGAAFGVASAWVSAAQVVWRGGDFSWRAVIIPEVLYWLAFGAASFFMLRLVARFPLSNGGWKAALAMHLPMSFLIPVAAHALYHILSFIIALALNAGLFDAQAFFVKTEKELIGYYLYGASVIFDFIIYAAIASAGYAVDFFTRFQAEAVRRAESETALAESAARLAQAERALTQAELHALKMQLNPHFLFNTLNAVSSLIYTSPDAADSMLARLGDFLRLTLDRASESTLTLDEELRFAECYLDIERVRFEDRLTIAFELAPETRSARVPTLILQPLVENAIKHGISKRIAAGTILIRSERRSNRLFLSVQDNGAGISTFANHVGIASTSEMHVGIGLANTRARLAQAYGDAARLTLSSPAGGGTCVMLELPFNETEPHSAAPRSMRLETPAAVDSQFES